MGVTDYTVTVASVLKKSSGIGLPVGAIVESGVGLLARPMRRLIVGSTIGSMQRFALGQTSETYSHYFTYKMNCFND